MNHGADNGHRAGTAAYLLVRDVGGPGARVHAQRHAGQVVQEHEQRLLHVPGSLARQGEWAE